MKPQTAMKAGLVGACSLNLLHETGRKTLPHAPQVDQIAIRALEQMLRRAGITRPSRRTLRKIALAGDLVSNSLYYSLIAGFGRTTATKVWLRATVLGLAAGVGAVALPPRMGLGQQPSRNFPVTAALTVSWYLLGALAAAAYATRPEKGISKVKGALLHAVS